MDDRPSQVPNLTLPQIKDGAIVEVEVHRVLRSFLRSDDRPVWPHHLTMGRLVARALRLGRSALIQTGSFGEFDGRYRLSYLMPLLMWPEPAILVVPESVHGDLLDREIPQLQAWGATRKAVRSGDRLDRDFSGLLLTSPQSWLRDRLNGENRFPPSVPTVIDGVDDLERWTRGQLTVAIEPHHWNEFMLAYPDFAEFVRDVRVRLTKSIFDRPVNPYQCCLLDTPELEILHQLFRGLHSKRTQYPSVWQTFWLRFAREGSLTWANIDRTYGNFSLSCGPINVTDVLSPIWPKQPIVAIGGALDLDPKAPIYRQRMGFDDLTCVKFSPDRTQALIQLYLPDGLPLPNTPQYQSALIRELHTLIRVSTVSETEELCPRPPLVENAPTQPSEERNGRHRPTSSSRPQSGSFTVILVGDVPLKSIVGSILAAEFGSRVQVEQTQVGKNTILVTGWEFWRQHQGKLPSPGLLAIATLPLPSLENPLVAGRVAHYKQQRQDWFRLYLLPTALSELQRAIAPVRDCQGVVALLDSRVLHRSYGSQILSALTPMARINYIDVGLFSGRNE